MDDETRSEFERLGSNIYAIETLLFALVSEVQRSRLLSDQALARVFNQAEDTITAAAFQLGTKAPPEYCTRALKVVTEIRAEFGLPQQ